MLESIAGPAGKLQLLQKMPAGRPRALAIVSHPHPLHGGSLHNKIVHQLARTFNQLGAVSVRFNFRGVGASGGAFDNGRGERQDLQAVAGWAANRWPELPQRLVTVAPAVKYFSSQEVSVATVDWLLIQGDADDVVPLDEVRSFAAKVRPRPSLVVLEGAGHFFHGRLNDLKQTILDYFPAT
jgi:alpha/beta superfamily hydrolase